MWNILDNVVKMENMDQIMSIVNIGIGERMGGWEEGIKISG